jgi:hypothetical protein
MVDHTKAELAVQREPGCFECLLCHLLTNLDHRKRAILDSYGGSLSHAHLAVLLVRVEVAFPEERFAFRTLKKYWDELVSKILS